MRGDSRRDLYAKTLALCGLGVLAGAGAVVDYWPVGVRFPAIAASTNQPAAWLPPIALSADYSPVASSAPLTAKAERPPSPPQRSEPAVVYASLPTAGVFAGDVGDAVELDGPPAPAFLTVSRDMPPLGAMYPELNAPGHHVLAERAPSGPSASVDHGFLAGAFKRTGTSIVKTSMKTGVSIFGAVRVVGSAVRRALPD